MAHFRWLILRICVVLVVISLIQFVAYIGVIRSTPPNECPVCSNVIYKEKPVVIDNKREFQTITYPTSPHTEAAVTKKAGTSEDLLKKERKRLAKDLKRLALDLIDTQRDVVRLSTIYHRLGEHITNVNGLLQSIQQPQIFNQNTLFNKTKAKEQNKNVVCPERFMGTDLSHGYPWFRKGFDRINCTNVAPLHQLITLVLHVQVELPKPADNLFTILGSIARILPGVRVILVTGNENLGVKKKTSESNFNISLSIRVPRTQNRGHLWSDILKDVDTPYVFTATDLTHFTDDLNLERLIRVLNTNSEIVIAGGGYRDLKGRWDVGCQQIAFSNWTMSFRGGYYQSFQDCLVCDYVDGPWVAKTDKLKELGFDRKLDYGVFHDLFWRIKTSNPGGIAVSCPDVMFNIHTSPVPDSDYVQLANKWEIKKWVESDGRVRWYGCRRGYEHNVGSGSSCSLNKGLGNPPCELENLADAIKFVMRECKNAGMFCELQEGTLLGAVKFNKVLPWERDADITFLTANYTAFKALKSKFAEQGYSLSDDDPSLWCCVDGRQAGGKFRVGTSRFTIEMYGQHMMESELLAARGQSPTMVHFAGEWVNVVRNPGLYARNRYGPNHFRHAEHWMDLGHTTGWSFYKPGHFSPCPRPGHSGCLDRYPADGNIQFSDYTTL